MRQDAFYLHISRLHSVTGITGEDQYLTHKICTAEVIARIAWRYRSELSPLLVAAAVFLAGWWAHLSTPHWYPYFIVSSGAVAWLLIAFGAWLGLPRLADRVYSGVTVFAAGA